MPIFDTCLSATVGKSDIFCKELELKSDIKIRLSQAGCHGRLKSTIEVNTGLDYIYLYHLRGKTAS